MEFENWERRDRALTSVPEQEQSIRHRLEIVLIGKGAKDFAQRAVQSEEAATFHPTASDVVAAPTFCGDDLTLFCPCVDPEGCMLARLRFKPIETFSQSLPLSRNELVISNTLIVFLVWNIQQTVDEILSDFKMRMAEINFVPAQYRPCLGLLAFQVDNEKEKALKDFSNTWQNLNIDNFFYDKTDDCTIMEAMRNVSDTFIAMKGRNASNRANVKTANLSCCTLL